MNPVHLPFVCLQDFAGHRQVWKLLFQGVAKWNDFQNHAHYCPFRAPRTLIVNIVMLHWTVHAHDASSMGWGLYGKKVLKEFDVFFNGLLHQSKWI